jgi:hypothetical protein
MSQSEKMMNGDLPPSSNEVFFKLESAQARMTILPVSVLPVKPSFRTTGCSAKACPIILPESEKYTYLTCQGRINKILPFPVTILMTPGGIPALAANSANFKAVKGQTSAGL